MLKITIKIARVRTCVYVVSSHCEDASHARHQCVCIAAAAEENRINWIVVTSGQLLTAPLGHMSLVLAFNYIPIKDDIVAEN